MARLDDIMDLRESLYVCVMTFSCSRVFGDILFGYGQIISLSLYESSAPRNAGPHDNR
jgi:hypothetical protein